MARDEQTLGELIEAKDEEIAAKGAEMARLNEELQAYRRHAREGSNLEVALMEREQEIARLRAQVDDQRRQIVHHRKLDEQLEAAQADVAELRALLARTGGEREQLENERDRALSELRAERDDLRTKGKHAAVSDASLRRQIESLRGLRDTLQARLSVVTGQRNQLRVQIAHECALIARYHDAIIMLSITVPEGRCAWCERLVHEIGCPVGEALRGDRTESSEEDDGG